MNNLQKSKLHNYFIWLMGLLIGICVTVFVTNISEIPAFVSDVIGRPLWHLPPIELTAKGILYFLAAALVLFAVSIWIVRILGNSARLGLMRGAAGFFVMLFVGTPIAVVIFMLGERFFPPHPVTLSFEIMVFTAGLIRVLFGSDKRSVVFRLIEYVIFVIGTNVLVYILCSKVFFVELSEFATLIFGINRVMLFAICFTLITMYFDELVFSLLKKQYRRCRLLVCQVKDEYSFEAVRELVSKKTFDKCHSAMLLNKDEVGALQFFKIAEMCLGNKKEAQSWNYYMTGDPIRMDEEQLCREFIEAQRVSSVDWLG